MDAIAARGSGAVDPWLPVSRLMAKAKW
jgi:hypothetical protein